MKPILYSSVPLDRAHALRRDGDALSRLGRHPDRLVAPCWKDLSLTGGSSGPLVGGSDAARLLALAEEVVLLGLRGDAPVYAADLSAVPPDPDGQPPRLGLEARWAALKAVGGTLPAAEAGILAYARALILWHRRTRFCGTCGAPTLACDGGHMRACQDPQCGAQHYPRTDPAVIMRVDGFDDSGAEAILMHRQSAWPAGMWSVLAGFVEPGETPEEAVIREVREESGIEVADIRYGGAQPWPFPSSLMIGFSATAIGGALCPDSGEIEDARWFSRARIAAEFDDGHRTGGGGPFLPRPETIARRLIDSWLDGKRD
jgi:NAD+ diphosphatase